MYRALKPMTNLIFLLISAVKWLKLKGRGLVKIQLKLNSKLFLSSKAQALKMFQFNFFGLKRQALSCQVSFFVFFAQLS